METAFVIRSSDGREFSVSRETRIGREPPCEILLREPQVSPLHATLWLQQDALVVRDEGTITGTFVNGARLPAGQPFQLRVGDLLRLGEATSFSIVHATAQAVSAPPPSLPPISPPAVRAPARPDSPVPSTPPIASRSPRLVVWAILGGLAALLLVLALGGGAFAVYQSLNRATATPTAAVALAATTLAPIDTPAPALTTPAPIDTPAPAPTQAPTLSPTHTPTFAPTIAAGSTLVSAADGMVMVFVPAGEFLMGSADSDLVASDHEKPQHTVTLDAFWIDRTEVTNAMYALCVQAGACQPPRDFASASRSVYYGDSQYDNYPVVLVSWDDAAAYCQWAGKRLPTEAEWEKAARGTDGRLYPWGNSAPDSSLLNFDEQVGDTTEVGKYPDGASPYSALDMAGNVWEWVADRYDAAYYQGSPAENPTGPSSGEDRVLRGGSWNHSKGNMRAAARLKLAPAPGLNYMGFRCARSP